MPLRCGDEVDAVDVFGGVDGAAGEGDGGGEEVDAVDGFVEDGADFRGVDAGAGHDHGDADAAVVGGAFEAVEDAVGGAVDSIFHAGDTAVVVEEDVRGCRW